MIKSFIARNIYEPLYCKFYTKDNRIDLYKQYKKMQWNHLQKNKKIQAQKLYELLKYVSENIPYYNKTIKKNNIEFSKETIFNDIKRFPVLTKEIIRKEFNNLNKIQNGVKWYYNTSGGSTGEPVKFIQDSIYDANSESIVRLNYEWAGYKLGDTFIKLWGSEKEIFEEKEKLRHMIANWFKSVSLLNSFLMDNKKMNYFIDTINNKKPILILAYVQSIFELAKFIKINNKKISSPNAIMTSAGILYPQFRKTIEDVFRCKVFNRYGSREVGDVACECNEHNGLHVNIFTHYIEILNKKMKPCKEGESGELYVTLLTNYTMPLIRYKIGDIAQYTDKKCACGRGMPLIKHIVGRDVDLFINLKG
jgi:phenylacetate-CoA ligase